MVLLNLHQEGSMSINVSHCAHPLWHLSDLHLASVNYNPKPRNTIREDRLEHSLTKRIFLLPVKSNVKSPPWKSMPHLDDVCLLYIYLTLQALHLKFINQSVIWKLDSKANLGGEGVCALSPLLAFSSSSSQKCLGNNGCFRKVWWTRLTELHQDVI